jgi:hypothetical protein
MKMTKTWLLHEVNWTDVFNALLAVIDQEGVSRRLRFTSAPLPILIHCSKFVNSKQ